MLGRVILMAGLAFIVGLISETNQAPAAEVNCPYLANDVEYRLGQTTESGQKREITYCRQGTGIYRTRDQACSPETGDYNVYFLDMVNKCGLPDIVRCVCDYKYYCRSFETTEGLRFKCMAPEDIKPQRISQTEGSHMMHLGDK